MREKYELSENNLKEAELKVYSFSGLPEDQIK